MFCKNCGKELPEGSSFCPHCATKVTEDNPTTTIEEPKVTKTPNKKLIIVVIAAIVCVALIITGIFIVPKITKKDPASSSNSANSSNIESNEKENSKVSSNPKAVEKDDALGLMNVKVRNEGVKLNDTEKLLVQYFDTDYFGAKYSALQRHPQIYKNSQITFTCYVSKIIKSNDEEYVALVEYGAYKHYSGDYYSTGNYAIIKGNQVETRIMEGDTLNLYGKYTGTDSYTIDGKSSVLPTILVNRFTHVYYFDVVDPMYTMEEIRTIAKHIFGNDIKLRYTKGDDFAEYDGSFDDPEYEGYYYTVELDNQSNANFTKYCFVAALNGNIIDCRTKAGITRTLTPSADFEHFYLQIFDSELDVFTLECYDRNLKKLWSREFDQTTSSCMDYTPDHIYLVANGSMYIIDAHTGENSVEPKYVGAKIGIRKLTDGILLLAVNRSDAVMKTDLTGKVLWTANLSYDPGNPAYDTEPPMVQIIGGNYVIEYTGWDNNSPIDIFSAVITPDGTVKFDKTAL